MNQALTQSALESVTMDLPQVLREAFDVLSDAPDGISKIRELILDLAVRGKLVPQDPDDEPASALLGRIAHTTVSGKADEQHKHAVTQAHLLPKRRPLSVPKTWEWCRLGRCCQVERGGSPRPIKSFLTADPDGLNWIKIGDTEQGGKYITSAKQKIIRDGLSKTRMVYPGDFLLTNSMSFGRPYITRIQGCIHDGWLRIHPPQELSKDFLYHLLSSPYIAKVLAESASGAVVQNLNVKKVSAVLLPIPPLAEQKRIVAKVDSLMALCDELESKQTQRNTIHLNLHKASLTALTEAQDPDDFADRWRLVANNFDTLITTPEAVDTLRQTILDLAVRGKLVPQDPNDEPASELLAQMEAEKARLVREKKIRKPKKLPLAGEHEDDYRLPICWDWSRLGAIALDVHYGYTASAQPELDDVKFLRITDIQEGHVDWGSVPGCHIEAKAFTKNSLNDGDLLIARTGGTVGKSYLVSGLSCRAVFASYLIRVMPSPLMLPAYLKHFFGTSFYWDQLHASTSGTGQPNVNATALSNLRVPIAPLAEQERIVTKVDSLMALCDSLSLRLEESRTRSAELATTLGSTEL